MSALVEVGPVVGRSRVVGSWNRVFWRCTKQDKPRIQQNSRSARSQENVLIMFMNSPESGKRFQLATAPVCLVIGALMMTACRGIPTQSERAARQDLKTVGGTYRPENQRPSLPTLQSNASLESFLKFAILNQP